MYGSKIFSMNSKNMEFHCKYILSTLIKIINTPPYQITSDILTIDHNLPKFSFLCKLINLSKLPCQNVYCLILKFLSLELVMKFEW